jgi:hypothetical protein
MLSACWLTKATNTLSEYAILISFPQQHECAAQLCYIYAAWLVLKRYIAYCDLKNYETV